MQIEPIYEEVEPGQDQVITINLVLKDEEDTPKLEFVVRLQ